MAESISCARVHVKRIRNQLGKGPVAWSSTIKIRTHCTEEMMEPVRTQGMKEKPESALMDKHMWTRQSCP